MANIQTAADLDSDSLMLFIGRDVSVGFLIAGSDGGGGFPFCFRVAHRLTRVGAKDGATFFGFLPT